MLALLIARFSVLEDKVSSVLTLVYVRVRVADPEFLVSPETSGCVSRRTLSYRRVGNWTKKPTINDD